MKQRISHGATIETVTPTELAAIVDQILTEKAGDENRHRHREKGVVQLDATGAGKAKLDVSPQFNWRMERITIGGNGAPNALVLLYENDNTSDADMLEVIGLGSAGRYSDGFANNVWIGAGNQLVVVVTGGVPSGQVTFNFQVRLVPSL